MEGDYCTVNEMTLLFSLQDMIKFGFSSREYILLHEHSIEIDDEGTP